MIILILILIVFDILSGVVSALKNNSLKSSVMRNGLYNKIGEIFSISFAYILNYIDITYHFNLPLNEIKTGIEFYIVLMEIMSIIENIIKINPQLKNFFKKFFNIDENKKEWKSCTKLQEITLWTEVKRNAIPWYRHIRISRECRF